MYSIVFCLDFDMTFALSLESSSCEMMNLLFCFLCAVTVKWTADCEGKVSFRKGQAGVSPSELGGPVVERPMGESLWSMYRLPETDWLKEKDRNVWEWGPWLTRATSVVSPCLRRSHFFLFYPHVFASSVLFVLSFHLLPLLSSPLLLCAVIPVSLVPLLQPCSGLAALRLGWEREWGGVVLVCTCEMKVYTVSITAQQEAGHSTLSSNSAHGTVHLKLGGNH